jgi:NADPH:quinone reductase-like Zn-dependent oxidoreductase
MTGPGQVRIRVEAAAVNPVDLATRSGALTEAGLVPPRDVTGIGWDAAGFVDAVAPGLTDFVRGDHVVGLSDRLDVPLGAQADYVVLDAGAAPVPLRGTRVHNVWIRADGERLAGLAAMAATRQLTLRVADTLPLDRVADAHARLAKGGLRGRLVLIP